MRSACGCYQYATGSLVHAHCALASELHCSPTTCSTYRINGLKPFSDPPTLNAYARASQASTYVTLSSTSQGANVVKLSPVRISC